MNRLLLHSTVSAVAVLLLADVARAQVATQSAPEEIVVTGIRASLQQSVATKRSANAIVDAITAEDIGKFPDKNVAESLSHVPGVTVDRDFGQGERVSIRGTDPALNRTLLNGQTVASADWFILDSPGRTFNYTLLAPEIVGRLQVYKSPEARLDEGSVGGTVILETRRPLDLSKPISLGASAEVAYNDRRGKASPNVSGFFGYKDPSDKWGIILSALHQQEYLQRDGFETFGYPNAADAGFPTAPLGTNNPATLRFPNAISSGLFQQERTRDGGTIGLQARPNDRLELNLTGLYVKANYDNYNQSHYFFNGIGSAMSPGGVTAATVNNGLITGATIAPGRGDVLLDAISRKSSVETYAVDLKGDYLGDRWKLTAQGGTTRATGGTQQQYFGEFENAQGYSYDISGAPGRIASVTGATRDNTSPVGSAMTFAQLRREPTTDEEQYGQLDFKHDLSGLGVFNSFQIGGKYRDHKTTRDAQLISVPAGNTPLANLLGGVTPSGFGDGLGLSPSITQWATADKSRLENQLGASNATYLPFLPEQFAVEEKISAAYGQLNFDGGNFRGNFGLRFVHTEQTSSGKQDITGNAIPTSSATVRSVVFNKTYNDYLPSVNIAFDATKDVVIRFAASRVMARANYADLSASVITTNTVRTGDGGNPNLDPYRANNFDISAEYYLGKEGLVSANAFYKDIESYIFRASAPETVFNTDTNRLETFQVSRPRNGGAASIKGFEVTYQNQIWNGFGIQANYTFSYASSDGVTPLPFNSRHSFNLTPYYENDWVSARITYGYRTKYFRAIDRATPVFNDEYNQLDASIAFKVTPQIQLTFQAQNLLDELQYQYAGTPSAPYAAFENGRRFFGGVRYNF
ncbi:TonB-dependent receptor [Roseiterribacter gracilis]|uniref:TonB-dependent receptor n=1 Tax=Roseiterribacter gracilis TaxID=2812848 RepID=UPI003B42FFB4